MLYIYFFSPTEYYISKIITLSLRSIVISIKGKFSCVIINDISMTKGVYQFSVNRSFNGSDKTKMADKCFCHDVKGISYGIAFNSLDPFNMTKCSWQREICKSNRKAMNRNWGNQKANPPFKTKAGNK